MADLLLELGTEEIPAGYIDAALTFLENGVARALSDARLAHGDVVVAGTPRRLMLQVQGVQDRQPDKREEVTGPRADVAWDKDGNLSKAGAGFLRGKGVEPEAAYRKETAKGVVIAAVVEEKGLAASEILPGLLEGLISKIPFPKTMRWSDERTLFARPLRRLLCLLDDAVLPIRFGSLVAGRLTEGHRFHFPEPVEVPHVAQYVELVAARGVMLSKTDRKARILERARALAHDAGGVLLEDAELLEEVANLVEYPWPLLGRFDARFLDVPKELLLSEMREHQRYFGIVDNSGALLPAFIVVAGSEPPDAAQVAAGNARVLRARFEDGAFYFHEDRKVPLAVRAERLASVVFQRQLGTVAEKVTRIHHLARWMAEALALPVDVTERTLRAADLCKADLVSGVVGEFPELQGTMGRYYALESGQPERVALAIEEHYAPRHAGAALPSTEEGAIVGIADRLDTLVGIMAIGKAPTGSADPFGLRRAAIAILRLAMARGWSFSLSGAVDAALAGLAGKVEVSASSRQATIDFLATRLRGVLIERCEERLLTGAGDIVDATIGVGFDDVPELEARTIALASIRAKDIEAFGQLAATFKRVGNILHKAREETAGAEVWHPDALVEPAEQELMQQVRSYAQGMRPEAHETLVDGYVARLEQVVSLKPAVDRFFDEVLVMAEEPATRAARLGLLGEVDQLLRPIADFTRIQLEG